MHKWQATSPSECFHGCECRPGTVLNSMSGECVDPKLCPCHHAGRSYSSGEVFQRDCNKWYVPCNQKLKPLSRYVSADIKPMTMTASDVNHLPVLATAEDGAVPKMSALAFALHGVRHITRRLMVNCTILKALAATCSPKENCPPGRCLR